MKIEYNNLYTHFVMVTEKRTTFITSPHRERIEKYITGIVNNNNCKMYAIYANPEHVHFLISRAPSISEEYIATVIANSSARFINENKLCQGEFAWQQSASAFSVFEKGHWSHLSIYLESTWASSKKNLWRRIQWVSSWISENPETKKKGIRFILNFS